MSKKYDLNLQDFDVAELWAFDEDADDGSYEPLHEIPYCHNGEIDTNTLFFRCLAHLVDGSAWPAIIAMDAFELNLYYLEVFRGDTSVDFHTSLGCDVDAEGLESFFARAVEQIFPITVEHRIVALDQTVRGVFG